MDFFLFIAIGFTFSLVGGLIAAYKKKETKTISFKNSGKKSICCRQR